MPQKRIRRPGAIRSGILRPKAFFSSSGVGFLNGTDGTLSIGLFIDWSGAGNLQFHPVTRCFSKGTLRNSSGVAMNRKDGIRSKMRAG